MALASAESNPVASPEAKPDAVADPGADSDANNPAAPPVKRTGNQSNLSMSTPSPTHSVSCQIEFVEN